jgi:hypothetical protein
LPPAMSCPALPCTTGRVGVLNMGLEAAAALPGEQRVRAISDLMRATACWDELSTPRPRE